MCLIVLDRQAQRDEDAPRLEHATRPRGESVLGSNTLRRSRSWEANARLRGGQLIDLRDHVKHFGSRRELDA